MEAVQFTSMKDGTREEYLFLNDLFQAYVAQTADRILKMIAAEADQSLPGYQITRVGHALQSATRAHREGADIDWIVGALLHDIGDALAPSNHAQMAAAIVRPYLREEVTWVVEHHGAFQMFYYAHFYGRNQFEREKFKDHPCYRSCLEFCERWDQNCFDPDYASEPLSFFEPMIREVFARKPYDPAMLRPGIVLGLPSPG